MLIQMYTSKEWLSKYNEGKVAWGISAEGQEDYAYMNIPVLVDASEVLSINKKEMPVYDVDGRRMGSYDFFSYDIQRGIIHCASGPISRAVLILQRALNSARIATEILLDRAQAQKKWINEGTDSQVEYYTPRYAETEEELKMLTIETLELQNALEALGLSALKGGEPDGNKVL